MPSMNSPHTHTDVLWTPQRVAEYLGISVRKLRTIRSEDATFPAPARLSTQVLRWRPDAIVEWVARKERVDRSDAKAFRRSSRQVVA